MSNRQVQQLANNIILEENVGELEKNRKIMFLQFIAML
jgi:hypothetical protein